MYIKNYIRTISISLTKRCNQCCPYCFRDSHINDTTSELTLEELREAVAKFKNANVMSVLLTGGEPFLRTDLPEILELLFNNNIQVTLVTNGTIHNSHVFEVLKKNKSLVKHVQVSIDGHNAELNDLTRGNGSFEKTKETVNIFKNIGLDVVCRITISKHNYRYIKEICNYVKNDLNISEITLNEIHDYGRANLQKELFINKIERIYLFGEVSEMIKEKIARIKVMGCDLEKMIIFKNLKSYNVVGGKLRACKAAFNGLFILENGDIIPCDMMTDVVVGNINEVTDLSYLWKNSPILNEIRERNNISLDKYLKCKGCNIISYCTGSCPAQDYDKTKTFNSNSMERCLKNIYEEYEDVLK